MMQAVEASPKRLQTDYIDLYWMHIWATHLNALDEASRIDLGFPQTMYAKELVRTLRYGGVGIAWCGDGPEAPDRSAAPMTTRAADSIATGADGGRGADTQRCAARAVIKPSSARAMLRRSSASSGPGEGS